MTLLDMKNKVLALIEELNPNSEYLTDDPDIQAKINFVINQIMFELIRLKKFPKYIEIDVSNGDILNFEDIEENCGYKVFQISNVGGVGYTQKAGGTVLKFTESGTAELDLYVFPEEITDKTKDKAYEFEISSDILEIMPYGVAADLLKSDVSAEYGNIYATRYESMKQMLDPRYFLPSVTIKGGIDI